MSIRKHSNELKVHEKTVGTLIKQDLSQELKPLINLYGAFWKQNRCNFLSKYWFALDCCWGGMKENVWIIYFEGIQIVWKVCWHNNCTRKKVAILIKFIVLCLSFFFVYSLKSKLILFYNTVIYHYTRIFLIFLPQLIIPINVFRADVLA